MSTSGLHDEQDHAEDGIHPPYSFSFPTEADRLANTNRVGVGAWAAGKFVRQEDTGELYAVKSTAPLEYRQVGGGAVALGELTDVSTAGATAGQALTYNGSSWAPAAGGGGGGPISDLSDVDTAGAVVGSRLHWGWHQLDCAARSHLEPDRWVHTAEHDDDLQRAGPDYAD